MMLRSLSSSLFLLSALFLSCGQAEELQDNRSLRLEVAYEPGSRIERRGGVDGAQDRALLLENEVLLLEQGERKMRVDLSEFAGDTFVVYGTGLVLPIVLDLPDGTRLHWTGPQLRIGETSVSVPKRGSFRYDAKAGALIAD